MIEYSCRSARVTRCGVGDREARGKEDVSSPWDDYRLYLNAGEQAAKTCRQSYSTKRLFVCASAQFSWLVGRTLAASLKRPGSVLEGGPKNLEGPEWDKRPVRSSITISLLSRIPPSTCVAESQFNKDC